MTDFAQRTIDLARQNVAESANKVAQTSDPTAHAEILAIREACTKLGTEHLVGTTIYSVPLFILPATVVPPG